MSKFVLVCVHSYAGSIYGVLGNSLAVRRVWGHVKEGKGAGTVRRSLLKDGIGLTVSALLPVFYVKLNPPNSIH